MMNRYFVYAYVFVGLNRRSFFFRPSENLYQNDQW
nr:MAG TPA: hypothetical protein [Caudoviricetes sp.]